MARGIYVENSEKARKVKKGYIGVEGTARLIRKGYVGVNGIARLFWFWALLEKIASLDALSAARYNLAGANVGSFALFAGGRTPSDSAVVDAYDAALTRTTPTALSVARYALAGASVGNYALFAGGYVSGMDYYNKMQHPSERIR